MSRDTLQVGSELNSGSPRPTRLELSSKTKSRKALAQQGWAHGNHVYEQRIGGLVPFF